jgi:hypothetical protein
MGMCERSKGGKQRKNRRGDTILPDDSGDLAKGRSMRAVNPAPNVTL